MAGFNIQYWERIASGNNVDFTVNYATGVGTSEGGNGIFTYNASLSGDAQAAVQVAHYFDPVVFDLQVGDQIYVWDNAAVSEWYTVTAVAYPNSQGTGTQVTIAASSAGLAPGSVTTAAIANGAVTYAKIQNESAHTLLGNPTGAPAAPSEITLAGPLSFAGTTLTVAAGAITGAMLANNAVTSTQLALNTIQFASVPLTNANLVGMYATPVQVLAAPAAGTVIEILDFGLNYIGGSAAFTSGGAISLTYGSSAHAAANLATVSIPATVLTAGTANLYANGIGSLPANITTANAIATAVFISNATGAFATGTGGSATLLLSYRVVAMS